MTNTKIKCKDLKPETLKKMMKVPDVSKVVPKKFRFVCAYNIKFDELRSSDDPEFGIKFFLEITDEEVIDYIRTKTETFADFLHAVFDHLPEWWEEYVDEQALELFYEIQRYRKKIGRDLYE